MERKVRTLLRDEDQKHLEILNLCFNPWGTAEKWQRKYNQPNFDYTKNVLVVEENNEWIGGGTAWFRNAFLKGEKKVKVYIAGDGYVLPGHTGKGVYGTTMRSLNQFAKSKGASLGLGFISIYETPFVALPKYGFVDIFYPKTRMFVLHAKNVANFFLGGLNEVTIGKKYNGTTLRMRIGLKVQGKEEYVDKSFRIMNEKLVETEVRNSAEQKYDLVLKADFQGLLDIFKDFYFKRKTLYIRLVVGLLTRRFGVRFSWKFLKTALRLK